MNIIGPRNDEQNWFDIGTTYMPASWMSEALKRVTLICGQPNTESCHGRSGPVA